MDLRNLYHELLKVKEEYFISLRDFIKIISCTNNYNCNERLDYLVLLTIEFLRSVNTQELKGMVEYVRVNGQFAFNAPSKYTFDHIIYRLIQIMQINDSSDKADLVNQSFYRLCERNKIL